VLSGRHLLSLALVSLLLVLGTAAASATPSECLAPHAEDLLALTTEPGFDAFTKPGPSLQ
jgi:hypothetical protein